MVPRVSIWYRGPCNFLRDNNRESCMRVGVMGTGHVGLLTCVSLSHVGHHVVGIDLDPEQVAKLSDGLAPFHEPGLQELLRDELSAGRLSFGRHAEDAIPDADVAFICVGT